MGTQTQGKVVVVSGPSGAGKTTVLKRVFQTSRLPLVSSVSATTRKPRPGEVDGVDYHFLTPEEFQRRVRAGEFLECFQVFGKDCWYGTLRSEVEAGLAAGKWVVLEIDVQGAAAVVEQYPDAVTLFIRPRSVEELERRLRGRGTENEEALQRRLQRARDEIAQEHRYRHIVVNDEVDRAVSQIGDILNRELGERVQC